MGGKGRGREGSVVESKKILKIDPDTSSVVTIEQSVITKLVSSECLPVLLYPTEACPFLARDQSSVSITVTRVLMKIFRTRSISGCY